MCRIAATKEKRSLTNETMKYNKITILLPALCVLLLSACSGIGVFLGQVAHFEPPAAWGMPADPDATAGKNQEGQPMNSAGASGHGRFEPTPTNVVAPNAGAAKWLANCDESVSLREAPDYGAKSIRKVLKGESVEVLGFIGVFAKVKCGSLEGYILSSYVKPESGGFESELRIVRPVENYSYEQMLDDMEKLKKKYPSKVTLGSIGRSEEGADIPVMIIGKPDAKHQVLVQGAMHGREHATAWLVMAQAEYMLACGSRDFMGGTIQEALQNVSFHIIPMSNPDGVRVSQQRVLSEQQRAIYESDKANGHTKSTLAEYAALWKANARGVDLNRNFDASWDELDIRDQPSSERYKGAAPVDQSESRALAQYAQKHSFAATVSYHATGSMLYYDYGNDVSVVKRSYDLARAIQDITGYAPTKDDELEAGGFKDWAMAHGGIPSVTVEVGCQEAPLQEREIPALYERNKLVLPAVAVWVKKG